MITYLVDAFLIILLMALFACKEPGSSVKSAKNSTESATPESQLIPISCLVKAADQSGEVSHNTSTPVLRSSSDEDNFVIIAELSEGEKVTVTGDTGHSYGVRSEAGAGYLHKKHLRCH